MSILHFTDLQAMTGYSRAGDVSRCLRRQGIKVFHGRGGSLWTTIALVNAAGGLGSGAAGDSPYPADAFR